MFFFNVGELGKKFNRFILSNGGIINIAGFLIAIGQLFYLILASKLGENIVIHIAFATLTLSLCLAFVYITFFAKNYKIILDEKIELEKNSKLTEKELYLAEAKAKETEIKLNAALSDLTNAQKTIELRNRGLDNLLSISSILFAKTFYLIGRLYYDIKLNRYTGPATTNYKKQVSSILDVIKKFIEALVENKKCSVCIKLVEPHDLNNIHENNVFISVLSRDGESMKVRNEYAKHEYYAKKDAVISWLINNRDHVHSVDKYKGYEIPFICNDLRKEFKKQCGYEYFNFHNKTPYEFYTATMVYPIMGFTMIKKRKVTHNLPVGFLFIDSKEAVFTDELAPKLACVVKLCYTITSSITEYLTCKLDYEKDQNKNQNND
ncbi:hypothetical protein QQ020_25990 [Fulvivirgaceae bacterium BMA12]|uniref:Uncharacterized protein n=1 Tax=Agaribacillus aureus TaxID=3051825 RepID=A0ABT8LFM2_9BACT|nr:hypothetical protein [Fulvivirgaceae bacterium BMA12]